MVSADNVSAEPPALEERREAMTISRELELTAMHWTVQQSAGYTEQHIPGTLYSCTAVAGMPPARHSAIR